MDQVPLKIDNLTKCYGEFTAVDQVCFEVQKGEVFGLLGPNGAGKTSIISVIVTLEQATQGTAYVFGHDVSRSPRKAKPCLGLVPQEIINHGYFTVEEILHFHSGYYGLLKNQKQIDYLLKRLALDKHRNKRVKQLSGGMKRRLLIAKALVHSPRLILLDEPTAGVDIELRASLWELVHELREDGVSILLTTHYLEEAEKLCDRVGILAHGKLRRIGETASLVKEFTQRRVVLRLKTEVPELKHSWLTYQEGKNLQFSIPPAAGIGDVLSIIQCELDEIEDINIQEGDLEEAFKNVLGSQS